MPEFVALPLSARVDGKDWYLYSVKYETADGVYSTYVYAISDDHAALVVQELRDTATVLGRVEGVVSN